MKPIPSAVAGRIAKTFGYDQVIIYARKIDGEPGITVGEYITTCGVTRRHTAEAARIGSYIKYKILGWLHDEL